MACRCAPWNGEYGKFYKTCGSDRTVGRGQISPVFIGHIEEDYVSKKWSAHADYWLRPSDMGMQQRSRRYNLGVHETKAAAKKRAEEWLAVACTREHGPGFSGRRR